MSSPARQPGRRGFPRRAQLAGAALAATMLAAAAISGVTAANAASGRPLAANDLPVGQARSLRVFTPGYTDHYLRHRDGAARTDVVNASSDDLTKRDASFTVRAGLADAACVSFESVNFPGQFLRHRSFRVYKDANDNSALFRSDATFCVRPGRAGSGFSLESKNMPGNFMRHRNSEVWVEQGSGSGFDQDATWTSADAWSAGGGTPPPQPGGPNLDDPWKKEVAMRLVSSAENSSVDWKAQYRYIEDIGDGRGYTAGIIGFCSGTGDMVELVQLYANRKPGNVLARYLPALHQVDGSDSHAGLDPTFVNDWRTAANDPVFQQAQNDERDRVYFNPSLAQGKADGLRALGQFAYYDAAVMHGYDGFSSIRRRALNRAKPPAQGGDETAYLRAFLDERVIEMRKEEAHSDTTRVDTEQLKFLNEGNLNLNTPLSWSVYGEAFHID